MPACLEMHPFVAKANLPRMSEKGLSHEASIGRDATTAGAAFSRY